MQASKQNLTYIIFLMAFALVGLVALQFYWVNVAIEVNKERFKQGVHQALNEVVRKLEQREIIYITQQNILRRIQPTDLATILIDIDSLQNSSKNQLQDSSKHPSKNHIALTTNRLEIKKDASNPIHFQSTDQLDALLYELNKLNKDIVNIRTKEDAIAFVLREQEKNQQKKINERINHTLLDSLLRYEIMNRGIKIPFLFGVESYQNTQILDLQWAQNQTNRPMEMKKSEFVFFKQPQQREKIMKAGFRVQLFPTELFSHQHLLYVYFPQQESYILQKMWWVFGTSVLFVGLVVYCFARAVQTIWKQKKISEITNDFINNMTHEFKTPISTISLACQALQDDDLKHIPHQQERFLHIIQEENERLGNQVEKVLQIAVLEKGDFRLKISTVDIHQVIEKVIRQIAIQVENRKGSIQTKLKAMQTTIEADEMHLSNILQNLLDNANKYSPESPEICISTTQNEVGVWIVIQDKGIGMSKETMQKVFDKFYRFPTGNVHNVKGFGLGLSYVKKMVEAHKGSVFIQSELEKGSAFTIFLPFLQEKP